MWNKFWIMRGAAMAALAVILALPTEAARIKDLCEVQGARGNPLKGVGLVVGLAGTGDKNVDAARRQLQMLDRMNVEVEKLKDLVSANTAVVLVDATLPAFAKEGTRIDVRVSSIGNSQSLEGGTLTETFLYGPGPADGTVYAVAQGPVSVGGFNAESAGGGGGAAVRKNHVTSGRIPMGAYVEREVPSTITDGERIALLLKRADFATAESIRTVLNDQYGVNAASALSASTITVRIPADRQSELISFIAEVEALEVRADLPARVVINERTGTLVVGGDVMIKPCQVAHGNLSIEIARTPEVSQPAPFSEGQTTVTATTELVAQEETAFLMPVEGTSAADVAAALNNLKVTPRDMIAIFQALRQAGALDADLEIM
ncbi:MAG TPA: flagellar basal body P-ring protein FlgI [Candidatus Hydrogenedentes bacterium]|nr:flagellar basal body P-ring protein FlgI [Candidatus Hydrogenedentota bacterium]HRK34222.1 flagellar basal body P-ring protein FlgI [Candidatus Hydrogenedentota bacterium]